MSAPLTPHQPSSHGPWQTPPRGGGSGPGTFLESQEEHDPRADLRRAAVVAVLLTVAGVGLGLLWLWLSPRVPLISDSQAVFLKDSEGEEAIGGDGTFVLLALAFGAVSAALAFWFHRRGGIALVVGLALGGLLGSLVAWGVGVWLGPERDVVAHAREVGKGVVFDAPLDLHAKGALLAWSLAAMVVHLALTAAFGPRDPEPDWGVWGVPGGGPGGAGSAGPSPSPSPPSSPSSPPSPPTES
ncbi:ABC transporter permease [Streptomyces sp. NPDC057486]|uniref:ABC transporter permease n=1 Tax=Streptomyces sp. NPDC057486 TaxID=3346145 RepID=UPI0036C3C39B